MFKKITLIISLILFSPYLFGQNLRNYSELVKDALLLYEKKDYSKSAQEYSAAFKRFNKDIVITDRYIAASSWALSNGIDSAFSQLFKLVNGSNFIFEDYVITNSDFEVLHSDKRWKEVIDLIGKKEDDELILDKALGTAFNGIYFRDIKLRVKIKEIETKFGFQSDSAKFYWEKIKENDSITLTKVMEILNTRGWLGSDIIGVLGNRILFLAIQHSDLETQEKYLPMMKEAVQKGNASPSNFAYLVDRVALSKGERQTFGSQLARDKETGKYFILPLNDPENVDMRRNEVGLGKIQDYISHFGMTWDAVEYKKQIPIIEEKAKKL